MFWNKGRQVETFDAEAEKLVQAAAVFAASGFMAVDQRFPALHKVVGSRLDELDFLVTVAAVNCSLPSLRHLKKSDADLTYEAIIRQLGNWSKDSLQASLHFRDFIDKFCSDHKEMTFSDSVGFWILLNLRQGLGDFNTDEAHSMQALGKLIVEAFSGWWAKR